MKIQTKLLFTFVFLTASSLFLFGLISIDNATKTIHKEVENALNSIVDEKVSLINHYIQKKEEYVATFARLPVVIDAMSTLKDDFKKGISDPVYLQHNEQYHPPLAQLKGRFNGYDLFLISTEGDIVFTLIHEDDFATNLKTGAYRKSQLAKVFDNAMNFLETQVSPFEPYQPSQWRMKGSDKIEDQPVRSKKDGFESHSGFVAAPIFKGKELIGVLVLQLQSKDYFYLAKDYTGLKSSGDVIISKIENDQVVIIAPLRHINNATFNLRYELGGDFALPIQWSATGKKGSGLSIGYKKTSILAAWRYIPELKWGIVANIETEEAFSSAHKLKNQLINISLVVVSLVAMIAIIFSRRIAYPILNLVYAAKNVALGDLTQQIEVKNKDEIGMLAHSFNHMIEQRQKYENELNESHNKLELVISATDIGVWDWQIQTGEVIFNERWANIIGYTLDELSPIGIETWTKHVHPDDLNKSEHLLKKHWAGETEHYHCEARMKHKSDQWVWVLDSGKVVEWFEDGRPKRMIGTHLDISKRKNIEIEREKTAQELILAKENAEQSAQAKSEFLASMSHEIRTPMNGVLGMLGLLLDTKLNQEQQHRAMVAQSSAQSLLTLINDVLDFSKIDAGKLELEMIDFNLRGMLGEFAEAMGLQAQEKNLELILDILHVDESIVVGDPGRLRQVLTNIVGNAIKFTTEGEIVIHVELQAINEEQWQFKCDIKDTGLGIPADKIPLLFDSFSQVDASTTRKFGGTGLGLAIVKQICELMHGGVEVTSELNKGSCFSIHLMLQKSLQSQKVLPKIDMKNLQLLVVDDNQTNREILSQQLEHWGISVTVAESGLQALHICEQRCQQKETPFFDVAILDMQMPAMDGAELGKQLKKDHRFKSMKLIMMTSMSNKGDAQYFSNLGFDGYFPKPATTSDLFDALTVVAEGGESLKAANPLVTRHYVNELKETEESLNNKTKKARILLVEDNQVNQMVAKGILKKMGFTADVAGNGCEAITSLINALENVPYHLVLMDCQMPEMDGFEATKNIRSGQAGEQNIDIPIIAMTANAMEGDRKRCIDSGMSDYLSKPIDRAKLNSKLVKWLTDIEY